MFCGIGLSSSVPFTAEGSHINGTVPFVGTEGSGEDAYSLRHMSRSASLSRRGAEALRAEEVADTEIVPMPTLPFISLFGYCKYPDKTIPDIVVIIFVS